MLSICVKIDGPLLFDLDLDTRAIAREMSEAAPKGEHPHDPPGWTTKSARQHGSGPRRGAHRLSNWLGNSRSWNPERFRPNAKASQSKRLHCSVFLAYALIQDMGGPVPAVVAHTWVRKRGKRWGLHTDKMTWQQGGRTVFAAARRGYNLPGKHYVQRGVDSFMRTKGITCQWLAGPPKTL